MFTSCDELLSLNLKIFTLWATKLLLVLWIEAQVRGRFLVIMSLMIFWKSFLDGLAVGLLLSVFWFVFTCSSSLTVGRNISDSIEFPSNAFPTQAHHARSAGTPRRRRSRGGLPQVLHVTSVALKVCEGQLLQGMCFQSKEGSTNLFIQTFGHFLEGDALDRLEPYF